MTTLTTQEQRDEVKANAKAAKALIETAQAEAEHRAAAGTSVGAGQTYTGDGRFVAETSAALRRLAERR